MTFLNRKRETGWWRRILRNLPATKNDIQKLENKLMDKLDQIIANVTEETTVIDRVVVLIEGIKKQLEDALSGTTLPVATQAKIDHVFAQVEINKAKLAAAVIAGTPAA